MAVGHRGYDTMPHDRWALTIHKNIGGSNTLLQNVGIHITDNTAL
jgi:hypothetical protein